jgi:hypothetical protein
VRGYLVPYLGTIPLTALSAGDVQAMFTAIARDEAALGRPVSAATLSEVEYLARFAEDDLLIAQVGEDDSGPAVAACSVP